MAIKPKTHEQIMVDAYVDAFNMDRALYRLEKQRRIYVLLTFLQKMDGKFNKISHPWNPYHHSSLSKL